MKNIIHYRLSIFWLLLLPLTIGSCSPRIAKYDKLAYQQAVSVKIESLSLMDKASTPYSKNENAVHKLKLKLDKAYEYAKGLPNNQLIIKQWSIMKDPKHNLLGGFLARWKEKGTLSRTFIKEAKINISKGFEQIIGLESGLIKPISCE